MLLTGPPKSSALLLPPKITDPIPTIERIFNNNPVFVNKSVKYLGITIDKKLHFAERMIYLFIYLFILEGPFEGKPDCVTQNFARFSLFLIPTHSENLIHLTPMPQKFKFWRTRLRGNPPLWHSRF